MKPTSRLSSSKQRVTGVGENSHACSIFVIHTDGKNVYENIKVNPARSSVHGREFMANAGECQ